VINVAGLCETDDGVNEDVGLPLTRCAHGQLAVSTVHGIACLEGDYFAPCQFFEMRAKLRRSILETRKHKPKGR
jgi:hypothetical protein